MSTTRLRFLCSCVRVGGWSGNCCSFSKGCTDIHFQMYGSALVTMTALEGSSLDTDSKSVSAVPAIESAISTLRGAAAAFAGLQCKGRACAFA